ncbi:hypothetical protein IAU59_003931 [Kwoniella sp. CBS 9459]
MQNAPSDPSSGYLQAGNSHRYSQLNPTHDLPEADPSQSQTQDPTQASRQSRASEWSLSQGSRVPRNTARDIRTTAVNHVNSLAAAAGRGRSTQVPKELRERVDAVVHDLDSFSFATNAVTLDRRYSAFFDTLEGIESTYHLPTVYTTASVRQDCLGRIRTHLPPTHRNTGDIENTEAEEGTANANGVAGINGADTQGLVFLHGGTAQGYDGDDGYFSSS